MLELNKVMVVGRLTRDPEVRFLPTGSSVASFDVAVDRRWRDAKTNEYVKETAFISCKAWNKQAEFVDQYFKKGAGIYVEGRIQQENWEKDGQKRSKLVINVDRVKFAETKAEADARRTSGEAGGSPVTAPLGEPESPNPAAPSSMPPMPGAEEEPAGATSDDLPF